MVHLIDVNKRGERIDFLWLPLLERVLHSHFRLAKKISLALVSDIEIRRLNRVYRHKDKVTDVLSFSFADRDFLGEVLICLPQARRQAKLHKHSLKKELKFLTVHGILHLLGYDHEKNSRELLRQNKMQEKILALL